MNILPMILKFIPGMSPQWRELITQSSKALGQYQNTRQDLLRAIADHNLSLDALRQGMPYLQSGPVAGISSIVTGEGQEKPKQQQASGKEADRRRGNPFPALNQ